MINKSERSQILPPEGANTKKEDTHSQEDLRDLPPEVTKTTSATKLSVGNTCGISTSPSYPTT